MKALLACVLLSLYGMAMAQVSEITVRSELLVQNSRGMLIPPDAFLYSNLVYDKVGRVELCLLDHELDNAMEQLVKSGWQVKSLTNKLGATSPTVFFLVAELPAASLAQMEDAKRLMTVHPAMPISEGLQRKGTVPNVDWRQISSVLGDRMFPNADHAASFGLDGKGTCGTMYGCPCGEVFLSCETTGEERELQSKLKKVIKARMHVTSIRTNSGKYIINFQGEGGALDLARRCSSIG